MRARRLMPGEESLAGDLQVSLDLATTQVGGPFGRFRTSRGYARELESSDGICEKRHPHAPGRPLDSAGGGYPARSGAFVYTRGPPYRR